MTTTQTTAPAILIGRCTGCRRAFRYDIPGDVVDRLGGPRLTACAPATAIRLAGIAANGCPDCIGKKASVKVTASSLVKVTHKPEIVCGGKCWAAVGSDCACSCEGKNHGGMHSQAASGF